MQRMLSLLALPALFATFAYAESWSGGLLDASCYDRESQQLKDVSKAAEACMATSTTSSFALHASGKVYKLDTTGNSKAAAAMKSRADRSVPGQTQAKSITAKIEGSESGGTIKAESVEVQ